MTHIEAGAAIIECEEYYAKNPKLNKCEIPKDIRAKLALAMKDEVRLRVPYTYSRLNDFIIETYMDCFGDSHAVWTMISLRAKISNAFIEKHADKLNPIVIEGHLEAYKKYREDLDRINESGNLYGNLASAT